MQNIDTLKIDMMNFHHSLTDELLQNGHTHDEYEIYYVIQGSTVLRLEDRVYITKPNSLFLIPPHTPHDWRIVSKQLCDRVSIHFTPEFLNDAEKNLLPELFKSKETYYMNVAASKIDFFVEAVLECRDIKQEVQKLSLKSRLVSLLTKIYSMGDTKTSLPPSFPFLGEKWIQTVIKYIYDNKECPISLETIAHHFHVNKNYLNILFRKETGTTVNRYIRDQRVYAAHAAILAGSSAKEAGYHAGFNDYSNFFRAHKAVFGVAPTDQCPVK
ncbi:MAG: AraC family transcriptional regulator [Treponema sp.]|jgi:AraC-like DNA-binding protein|nr:AraC family transcriptional regulator [Treponema sp.]